MKTLIKYFFQGLLYTLPLTVTGYIIYKAVVVLDSLVPLDIPGLGLVSILALITLVGVVGSYLFALPIFSWFESQIERAPLVKVIYTSVKDLVNAFVGQKKNFTRPVLVRLYPGQEVYRVGFLTDEDLEHLGVNLQGFVSVYVPHSYAISGQLFVVPASAVHPFEGNSTEVMKYIISGGVTRAGEEEETENPQA
jgi:uncharacterized membrane protein